MSYYCTICGNMVPAQGTHHCQRYDHVFTAGTTYEPDEISKLKLVIKAKNKYIEIQDIIISGQRKEIGTKDKEIARLQAMVQELKCCGNCKWDLDLYEENCKGCCELDLQKWELRE